MNATVSEILMCTVIHNICLYPVEVAGVRVTVAIDMLPKLLLIDMRADVATDVSTVLTFAIGADIWTNLEFIIVVAAVVVAVRFIAVIIAACGVVVSASMSTGILVCGASSASPELNANCLDDMLASL